MAKPIHILLVEDDEDDRLFFVEAINDIDVSIGLDIAANGMEALLKLHKALELPDIIFMDVNMPVMGGFDCLRKLKSLPRYNTIPVVILTTTSSFKEQETSDKLGASLFFTKPPVYSVLRQRISQALQVFE